MKKSIISSFSSVSLWTAISRVFGLVRDIATTSLLGASFLHDIFVVVLKIPNLFRRFFAEGAFSQAFIPVYSKYVEEKNKPDQDLFLHNLFSRLFLALTVFTVLVIFLAPFFIFLFAPGFYLDETKKDIAIISLKIMFPYLGLISLVAFAAGIQNTHTKFAVPAGTPIIFNVSLILAAIFIAPYYDIPIISLAWAVLIAGLIQVILNFYMLYRLDRFPKFKYTKDHPGVKKVFKIMIPALIAGGVTQLNLLIDTIYASLLTTGSPTWLYVSDRLIQLPLGVFAIALGTVLLPRLSRINIATDFYKFRETLMHSQKLILFIALPSIVGLIMCSNEILATIFLRGSFSIEDVNQSSLSLIAFSAGLPFFMLLKIYIPAFFSRQDTKTPLMISLMSLLINAFLNYVLAFKLGYGHIGIAAGSSIAAIVSVLVYQIILFKQDILIFKSPFTRFNFSLLASLFVLIYFLNSVTDYFDFYNLTEFGKISSLSVIVLCSILIFALCIRILLGKSYKKYFIY